MAALSLCFAASLPLSLICGSIRQTRGCRTLCSTPKPPAPASLQHISRNIQVHIGQLVVDLERLNTPAHRGIREYIIIIAIIIIIKCTWNKQIHGDCNPLFLLLFRVQAFNQMNFAIPKESGIKPAGNTVKLLLHPSSEKPQIFL